VRLKRRNYRVTT